MPVHPVPLDNWCWRCPCGARADDMYGICRKCQARTAWRRRTMRPRRIRRAYLAVIK
jgi:hypothetical protein